MSKRNSSVSHYFEPSSMRGSLNVGYRKNEVLRINKGNRKMLDQLRQVKPAVGTYNDWQKHEQKQSQLKRHIRGMNLDKAFKSRRGSELNSTAYTYNGPESRVTQTQNSQRPPKGKFVLPKLGPDGTMISFVRQAETAGVNKRRRQFDHTE